MIESFPNFTRLDSTIRAEYDAKVTKYPAMSDLSFATLMIWWNFENNVAVSSLNDNLVISYNLPGEALSSGLSLVGTNRVDASIETLFAEMTNTGKLPRLVHVPDFVINKIAHPENFNLVEERDYAEYVVPASRFYPFDSIKSDERYKLRKFLNAVEGHELETRSLDLSNTHNQKLLLTNAKKWWQEHGKQSDARGDEIRALQTSVTQASELDISNVCLFIDGELYGFSLFQVSHDGQYLIGNHLKTKWGYPRIFDYMAHITAGAAIEKGVPNLNVEMDLGIEGLRQHKMEMHPERFLRKYTVMPALYREEVIHKPKELMPKLADSTI
ncbi:MAG TPA: phosphatidylglycerol lysyltransferase domain-containing protein [Candidatus Saccharimonadales bacterium]|nr:phosphatidylglycerol lysyltransferase domain-containing protein [Candidatus Saccharimonadales bacterium]